jgi:hypothetical protein
MEVGNTEIMTMRIARPDVYQYIISGLPVTWQLKFARHPPGPTLGHLPIFTCHLFRYCRVKPLSDLIECGHGTLPP